MRLSPITIGLAMLVLGCGVAFWLSVERRRPPAAGTVGGDEFRQPEAPPLQDRALQALPRPTHLGGANPTEGLTAEGDPPGGEDDSHDEGQASAMPDSTPSPADLLTPQEQSRAKGEALKRVAALERLSRTRQATEIAMARLKVGADTRAAIRKINRDQATAIRDVAQNANAEVDLERLESARSAAIGQVLGWQTSDAFRAEEIRARDQMREQRERRLAAPPGAGDAGTPPPPARGSAWGGTDASDRSDR